MSFIIAASIYDFKHGLQTPNESIDKRYLKNWADVADKICFGRIKHNMDRGFCLFKGRIAPLPDELNLYLHGFPRLVMKHEVIEVVHQRQTPLHNHSDVLVMSAHWIGTIYTTD